MHTQAHAHSISLTHTYTHMNADTSMSCRATDTSMEKVRMSKLWLKCVLTAQTLTAYIERIHRDSERPVTSVSCNWWDNVKTFKICKLLQHDCTVWRLDWGKRDKSFHPDWLLWHVLCRLLLRVFPWLYKIRSKSSKINPASFFGIVGGAVCLHVCVYVEGVHM